jgi:hypothetical protein
MMAKYGVLDDDLYNFDETGFMMGVITASMVVTRSDRHGKAKSIQPGNREWATVIECINAKGWCIPPFVIVQGAYHLANWTTPVAPKENGKKPLMRTALQIVKKIYSIMTGTVLSFLMYAFMLNRNQNWVVVLEIRTHTCVPIPPQSRRCTQRCTKYRCCRSLK